MKSWWISIRSSSRCRRAASSSVISLSERHVANTGHLRDVVTAEPRRAGGTIVGGSRPVDPRSPVEARQRVRVFGLVRAARFLVPLIEPLHLPHDPPVLLRGPLPVAGVV